MLNSFGSRARLRIQDIQQRHGVHLLSGALPASMRHEQVFGLVCGNAIIGANFVRDFFARVTDFTGGRASGYERAVRAAVEGALEDLAKTARELEANAVTDIEMDISAMGRSMLMAVAYGTAVLASEDLSGQGARAQAPAPEPEPAPKYLHSQPLG
jgi:uncharacterized protein YbjQ (UPF0145 family)